MECVLRAEFVSSDSPWLVGASIVINAPASDIFRVVANPRMHPVIDGSNMVKGEIVGPDMLSLGSSFWMRMADGVPYAMKNTCVEFEQDRVVAWRPAVARNIWRYELEPLPDGSTRVTQWMDGRSTAKFIMKREIKWAPKAMAKTLVKLKEYLEQ